MKKILFIVPMELKDPVRGTPLRVVNFIRQIQKENQVTVVAKSVDTEFENNYIEYPLLNLFKKLGFFKKIIQDRDIDIVMTATETGIKLPVILKILTGVKIAIDLHGLYYEELLFFGKISRLKKNWESLKVKFYLLFYDAVFTVSQKLSSYYSYLGKRVHHIYGGVNIDEFKLIDKFPNEVFTIGYMGNARSYQGLNILLNALEKINDKLIFKFKLVLVVSGELGPITKMLEDKNLAGLTEVNHNVAHEKVNELIQSADVLVIPRPSLVMTEFAYPSKTPEYLATGIVTINSNVGPVQELFLDKEVALIVEKSTDESMVESLKKVYDMPLEERQKLGQRARDFVEQNLTWDVLGHKINSVLNNI